MSHYNSSTFGEIDLNNVKDYYQDVEIELKHEFIEVDLNIEETVSTEQLQEVDDFIKNLERHEKEVHAFLLEDYVQGGIAKEYIDFHSEEFDDTEIKKILGRFVGENKSKELYSALYLSRIGFYPESEDSNVVFDYTVHREMTDQLLIVRLSSEGDVEIDWES
jgi:hypothetical protein